MTGLIDVFIHSVRAYFGRASNMKTTEACWETIRLELSKKAAKAKALQAMEKDKEKGNTKRKKEEK